MDRTVTTTIDASLCIGCAACVEALLDAGARVDEAPDGDPTPLIAAARGGHDAVVVLTLAGLGQGLPDPEGLDEVGALVGRVAVLEGLAPGRRGERHDQRRRQT